MAIGAATTQATAQATPTAAATAANSASSLTTTAPQDNNPAATAAANTSALANGTAKDSAGGAITGFSSPSASTTTISNTNKQQQVSGIQNTTNNLSQTGSTQNPDGSVTNSNGTITPTPPATAPNPQGAANPATTTSGGYQGDVYYPPGATVPLDSSGNPVSLTETSPTDDKILSSLQNQITQSDAVTASVVQGIQSQYSQYIQQQQQANNAQQGKTNAALLMGGVTGQGSSSQYAPISSANLVQAQVSYGISQLSDLQNKENQAILAAQQAGQNQDFQLQDKINTQISNIRDNKVAAATNLNNQIAAQNKTLADQQLQSTIDNAISTLYKNGTTDPTDIMNALNKEGFTVTADQVAKTVTDIGPSAAELQRQQAALTFAENNNVTQPFYLVGNTAINTQTGQPASLADYQKATGQQVGLPANQTDFSKLQTLADPQVTSLQSKYPDAGITPQDTMQEATAKLQNSALYRKETYIAPTAASAAAGLSDNDIQGLVSTLQDYNGQKYVTATDLTGYTSEQKGALITNLKQAGIPTLSPKDSDALNTIQSAQTDLNALQTALKQSGIQPKNWLGRPVSIADEKLSQWLQTNNSTALQTFNATAIPLLAALKGVGTGGGGGGGALLYNKATALLPQPTDTVAVANQKIAELGTLLNSGANAIMPPQQAPGQAPPNTTVMTGPQGTFNVPNSQVSLFKSNGYK